MCKTHKVTMKHYVSTFATIYMLIYEILENIVNENWDKRVFQTVLPSKDFITYGNLLQMLSRCLTNKQKQA